MIIRNGSYQGVYINNLRRTQIFRCLMWLFKVARNPTKKGKIGIRRCLANLFVMTQNKKWCLIMFFEWKIIKTQWSRVGMLRMNSLWIKSTVNSSPDSPRRSQTKRIWNSTLKKKHFDTTEIHHSLLNSNALITSKTFIRTSSLTTKKTLLAQTKSKMCWNHT